MAYDGPPASPKVHSVQSCRTDSRQTPGTVSAPEWILIRIEYSHKREYEYNREIIRVDSTTNIYNIQTRYIKSKTSSPTPLGKAALLRRNGHAFSQRQFPYLTKPLAMSLPSFKYADH